jgi:glycosyltransferase involved in cell wall biosynthesis
MKLQVLVSTMNQSNFKSLIDRMRISTETLIINQCDKNEFEEFSYNRNRIRVMSLAERGIGLSRNTALMRADAEICMFADDDLVYVDNYDQITIEEFKKNPKADIILFNIPSTNIERPTCKIDRAKRVRWYNSHKYGAVNIVAKTESLKRANVAFSLLFGGGARYSAGEDSMFILDCLRKGLKIYSSPKIIGFVDQNESTWFKGYVDKYFIDKGIFYACTTKQLAPLLCLQFAIRHRNLFKNDKSFVNAFLLMLEGTREWNKKVNCL